MEINNFHEIFCRHLRNNQRDVARIIALDTDNEKWFQGELVLAFSNSLEYKILSSEYYNKFENMSKKNSWKTWAEVVDNGIVTIEADVYKKVKVEKSKATGVQKVDFLMEDQNQQILSEIKILWLNDNRIKNRKTMAKHLENRGVIDDAWRLTGTLPKDVCKSGILSQSFLTLICLSNYDKKQSEFDLKRSIIDGMIKSFGNFDIDENKIIISSIITESSLLMNICAKYPDNGLLDWLKNVCLITVELERR